MSSSSGTYELKIIRSYNCIMRPLIKHWTGYALIPTTQYKDYAHVMYQSLCKSTVREMISFI